MDQTSAPNTLGVWFKESDDNGGEEAVWIALGADLLNCRSRSDDSALSPLLPPRKISLANRRGGFFFVTRNCEM